MCIKGGGCLCNFWFELFVIDGWDGIVVRLFKDFFVFLVGSFYFFVFLLWYKIGVGVLEFKLSL